jgi:tripartite-type tricarboxylate transporter receptor subunit TctC
MIGSRRVASALTALLAVCGPACAQETYPSKAITLIVPFPAGGSTDVIGRLVAEGLRQVLGQAVVVDNRAGAGGSLGTAAIAKAPPDGYTIGMGTASTLAINPATYKSLPFDVLSDLVPIGDIAAVPNIMSVNPGVKAANMAEFIALAKAEPGKLSYASPGYGSVAHLLGEQFKLATGTDILHVPYRGMGPALNDAIGGQVQVIYDNLPTSLELVRSGKLRALGVSGEKRVATLPDVPTFGELHLDDINWMAFFGLIAPKDTPAPIVTRLNEALVQALANPGMRDKLAGQQALVVGNSPEAFKAEIARELARFKRAVAAAKIELN